MTDGLLRGRIVSESDTDSILSNGEAQSRNPLRKKVCVGSEIACSLGRAKCKQMPHAEEEVSRVEKGEAKLGWFFWLSSNRTRMTIYNTGQNKERGERIQEALTRVEMREPD
jgi:hypothetical protein